MKKIKSMMLLRTLLVLFFTFLWGGILNIHAEKKAWVKYNNGTLTFQYGEKETLENGEYWLNEGNNIPGWNEKTDDVTEVVFDASFAQARPSSCYYWFNSFKKLKAITGIENLNTSNVTDMQGMFCECFRLTSLDVSHFDTSNVMDMSKMFNSCYDLTSLDVSHFDTSNVTDMSKMFSFCNVLTSLDVSNFNTSKVTNMGYMFSNCALLKSLDVSHFGTSNVTDMKRMFSYCSGLTSLDVSHFDTSNVTDMSSMFSNCSGLTSLDVFNFNTSKVTNMESMFSYCSNLTSLNLSYFNTSNVTTMTDMFCGCSNLRTIFASNEFVLTKVINGSDMFKDCTKLQGSLLAYDENKTSKTYATIDGGYFRVAHLWVKLADGTLTFLYGEKESLGTDEYWLKEDMTSPGWILKNDDVTAVVFDASFAQARPISCYFWFNYCKKLKSIKGIEYLNTSNVTYMTSMFDGCSSLTSLDVSHFDTSKVTYMNGMFYGCSSLTSLDVSHFDTSNVIYMNYMFSGCSSLTSLDVSHFDTSNIKEITGMFDGCSGLTSLDVSHFDTSKVKYMYNMFYGCSSLTSLDVSHFDISNVKEINHMFYNCSALKSIYFGDNFNVGKLSSIKNNSMLTNCPATLYCSPLKYKNFKSNSVIASYDNAVKPYVGINSKSEYGTLCVPVGSSLAEDSYTGFDKLYTLTNADKNKGIITLTEAKSIEPGVAYVYHRYLEGVDFVNDTDSKDDSSDQTTSAESSTAAKSTVKNVISFEVDASVASVTEPKNDDSMLKGTFESIVAPSGKYILQTDGMFHPVAADNTTLSVGAYRAYLDLSSTEVGGGDEGFGDAKAYRMVFSDGETTAINAIVDNVEADKQTEYFDIMGRKVNVPQKGYIYIKNGKKIVF